MLAFFFEGDGIREAAIYIFSINLEIILYFTSVSWVLFLS